MTWSPAWSIRNTPQGTLSGRRTATMQVRSIWDSDAHAVQVAGECDLVSGAFSMPRLAAMMTANPQLIFGPYLKSVQNPVAGDPGATLYPTQWYVKTRDGSKAQQGGQYVNWLMETGFYPETRVSATIRGPLSGQMITASCWADFHVQDSVAKVATTNAAPAQGGTHPYRALWFDSADTFSADAVPGFWTGTNPGWNPHTLAAYQKQEYRDMVGFIGDAARNSSFLGTLNTERLWVAGNGLRTASFAAHWDMAMVEGWLWNNGGQKFTTAASWEALMQTVLDCQLIYGTVAQSLDWGGPSASAVVHTQQRRLAAASDLLVNRGLKTFEYISVGKSERPELETAHDPSLYAMDLGSPLSSPATIAAHRVTVGTANGQASGTGLYSRLYDGGAVLANLAGTTILYKADRTYTQVPSLESPGTPSFTAGQQITVPSLGGVFVTHAGGTGSSAPVNTRAPAVLGTTKENQTLTVQAGTWTGSPAPTLTEQWQQSATGTASWSNISGASSSSWTIPVGTGGGTTTYELDAFSGTVANGWGTADTGDTWAIETGSTANLAKTGGYGTFSHATASASQINSLNLGQADADGTVTVNFPGTVAGGNLFSQLLLRYQDSSNYLELSTLNAISNGHVTVTPQKVIAGAATALGSAKDLGAYAPGQDVKLRFRVSGSNIQGWAWMGTAAMPGTADWNITDSSLLAAGKVAIRSQRATGNTNSSPQTKVKNLGVTSTTSTGGATYVGQFVRTVETATNTAGTVTANSAAVGPITSAGTAAPAWTTQPSITGTLVEGNTITGSAGVITGTPTPTQTYQWQTSTAGVSWSNVSGGTATTLDLASGDATTYKRFVVTAANTSGTASASSPPAGPIAAGDTAPVATVAPVVSGDTVAGGTATLATGTWTGSPAPALTQQWQSSTDGGATFMDITGELGTAYLIQTGDAGNYLRATVTGTSRAGVVLASAAAVGPITLPSSFPNLTIQIAQE